MSDMNLGHQTKEIHQPLPKRKKIQLGEKKKKRAGKTILFLLTMTATFQFRTLFMASYNHVAEKNNVSPNPISFFVLGGLLLAFPGISCN